MLSCMLETAKFKKPQLKTAPKQNPVIPPISARGVLLWRGGRVGDMTRASQSSTPNRHVCAQAIGYLSIHVSSNSRESQIFLSSTWNFSSSSSFTTTYLDFFILVCIFFKSFYLNFFILYFLLCLLYKLLRINFFVFKFPKLFYGSIFKNFKFLPKTFF